MTDELPKTFKFPELDKISGYVASVASLSIVASVVYEFSYILGLGLAPNILPINISDIALQAFSLIRFFLSFSIGLTIGIFTFSEVVSENVAKATRGEIKSNFYKYTLNPAFFIRAFF